MRFGLLYELQMPKPWYDGQEYDIYWQTMEQIELAEAMGFDYCWVVEHHFQTEFSHSSAPEVFLGAISQRTKTIRIGHGVALLPYPYNHPIRVAERVAVLDIMSNGRIDLGTGRSTSALEMGGFEIDPNDTRPMWEEGLKMIPEMWLNETFSWDGDYYRIPPRQVIPKPVQKPHPPIWMAATQPSSFSTAGQFGLGALAFGVGDPNDLKSRIQIYRENIKNAKPIGRVINNQVAAVTFGYCDTDDALALEIGGEGVSWFTAAGQRMVQDFREAYGTDVESYRHYTTAFEKETGYGEGVSIKEQVQSGALCIGDPDTCLEVAKKYQEIGVDQLVFIMQIGHIPHNKIVDSIKLFGDRVIPFCRD